MILHSIIVLALFLFHGMWTPIPGPESAHDPRSPQDRTGVVAGKIEVRAAPQLLRNERSGRYGGRTTGHGGETNAENVNTPTSVVVYLEGPGLENTTAGRKGKAVMDQKNERFVPHVLVVQKGTSVEFVNHDRVYHNVFSLSSPKKFNIGRRPTGEEVPVTFDKQGVVQVFCDIHSQMSGFVVILDNPCFAQPEEDGSYRIENVPPGTYTIKVWHERFSAPGKTITVLPGGQVQTNFVLE